VVFSREKKKKKRLEGKKLCAENVHSAGLFPGLVRNCHVVSDDHPGHYFEGKAGLEERKTGRKRFRHEN